MTVQFEAVWREDRTVFENIGYLQIDLLNRLKSFHAPRKKSLIKNEVQELHEIAEIFNEGGLDADEVDERIKERIRLLNRSLKKNTPRKKTKKERTAKIIPFPFEKTALGRNTAACSDFYRENVPSYTPTLKLIVNEKFNAF